jgi:hypothetical protein
MWRLLFFVFLSIAPPAFAGPATPQHGDPASGEPVPSMKIVACELLRLRRMSYVIHLPCRAGESAVTAALARDLPLLAVSIAAAIRPEAPTVPEAIEAMPKNKMQ